MGARVLSPVIRTPEAVTTPTVRIEAPSTPRHGNGIEDPAVYTVTMTSAASPWFGTALNRISRLTSLAVGWNGYESHEIRADMVMEAVEFLTRVAFPGIAAPAIVPLADGGVQVEWHSGGLDIEVAFSDEDPGVYVEDRQSGKSEELSLVDAASVIGRFSPRLADS